LRIRLSDGKTEGKYDIFYYQKVGSRRLLKAKSVVSGGSNIALGFECTDKPGIPVGLPLTYVTDYTRCSFGKSCPPLPK
jgi:hypothetical protein